MRTVTVLAYNRPRYTASAIKALGEALLAPGEPIFDRVIFSIDPGNDEVVRVCEAGAELLSHYSLAECSVYVNSRRESSSTDALAEAELIALSRAFELHDSDFNLSIEDDAVLMPDAAILAKWFHSNHGSPDSRYLLMSMCNHRDFGRNRNPGNIPNDPSYLAEANYISSPFAWCMSRHQWPYVESRWNFRTKYPMGYDWSLTHAMRIAQRRSVHPVLSRCQNIGREGGTHESPESFDQSQTGLVYSDGTYRGDYQVVVKLPDEELQKLDPWMVLV